MPHRFLVGLSLLLTLAACRDQSTARRDSARRVLLADTVTQQGAPVATPTPSPDSTAAQPTVAAPAPAPAPQQTQVVRNALSPRAQAVAERLVFVPKNRSWMLAAVRARRFLVDLGRIDAATPKDSAERRAFREAFNEAAARYSPIPLGAKLRVFGSWGNEIATISGFDTWNGRIVGVLKVSHALDSIVRRSELMQGSAVRVDSVQLAARDSVVRDSLVRDSVARVAMMNDKVARAKFVADSIKRDSIALATRCVRDSVPIEIVQRIAVVRDSLERWLTDSAKAPYPRLEQRAKTTSWSVNGCFNIGRVIVVASRRDPGVEFAAERAVMLSDSGKVTRLRLADLRFRVHEPLSVFDADGDGIDDVATRALGERSGGLSIMRLDVSAKRLQRLAAGFSWETR